MNFLGQAMGSSLHGPPVLAHSRHSCGIHSPEQVSSRQQPMRLAGSFVMHADPSDGLDLDPSLGAFGCRDSGPV